MSKRVRKKPQSVAARLRFLAPHIDGFKTWLHDHGYRPATIVELVRLLACWADWMQAAGFGLTTISAGFEASAAVFQGCKTIRAPRAAATLFIRYLQEQGTLPEPRKSPSPAETWPILAAFRAWMRSQRGVVDSTLDTYQSTLVDFLKVLGDDPKAFTAQAVRAFVLDRARAHSRGRAQSVAVATRAFLRFLVATGQCPVGRDYAVPGFANWQLASTPCFLDAADIDRVIAACDGEERLRDKTIILLLARLGLRASEVANLTLAQIDWANGRITVAGKSRREEWLPLTQEVGDAMIAYIERARSRFSPLHSSRRSAARPISAQQLRRSGPRRRKHRPPGIAVLGMSPGSRVSSMPRTLHTKCRWRICSLHANRDRSPTSTAETNSPASLMPPPSSGGKSPIPCVGSSM